MMKRELTLPDIVGYLPYGLYCWYGENIKAALMAGITDYQIPIFEVGRKPILRPMSDLYVEITERGYNDGKPIVPILEIGKLSGYDCIKKYETEGVTEYGFECRNADDVQGYVFGWCQTTQSFGVWYDHIDDEMPSVESMIMNTDIFDLFHRLHLDYRGLIPAGLAVSVHDLSTNPYET